MQIMCVHVLVLCVYTHTNNILYIYTLWNIYTNLELVELVIFLKSHMLK